MEESSARDDIHTLLDEALLLSEDLFHLQEVRTFLRDLSSPNSFAQHLLEVNGEITPPPRKRIKLDHGGDYAAAVSASSKALADMESACVIFSPMFHRIQPLTRSSATIPTWSRPSQNGPTRSNPSRPPPFCLQTAMRLRNPLVTNSRMPFNSSRSHSPTRPVGQRWLTELGFIGVKGRG